MNQMTIFEAIEKAPASKPKKIGFLNRWHIVKCYEDELCPLVGTVIPGDKGVRFMPTKIDYSMNLDYETHNKVMTKSKIDMSYEEYEKWLVEYGFEEREIKK